LLYNRTFASTIETVNRKRLQEPMMSNLQARSQADRTCRHTPRCPSADAADRDAAHVLAAHPEQGWSLLCNGVVLFEDFGEILPDGHCTASRRRELATASPHRAAS
jgi:hypothetical protein